MTFQRTYFIWKCLIQSYDETWYAYPLWICAAVEIDLAVLCACAPALRPLLVAFAKPIMDSLYGSGSNSQGDSKNFSTLSSKQKSRPSSQTQTQLDFELDGLEKMNTNDTWEHSSTPKRKLSRTKGLVAIEEPTRLSIMERRSFEVHYEDRNDNDVAGRRSADTPWRGPRAAASGELSGSRRPVINRPHTSATDGYDSRLQVPPQIPQLSTPSPISASFIGLQPDDESISERYPARSRPQDSFYISEPSVAEEDESAKWFSRPNWPLSSVDEASSKSELKDGERTWDIESNPFRDPNFSAAVESQRASSSAGVPSHSRWRSEPHLWTEIHSQRQRSAQRSGSLTETPVARMI